MLHVSKCPWESCSQRAGQHIAWQPHRHLRVNVGVNGWMKVNTVKSVSVAVYINAVHFKDSLHVCLQAMSSEINNVLTWKVNQFISSDVSEHPKAFMWKKNVWTQRDLGINTVDTVFLVVASFAVRVFFFFFIAPSKQTIYQSTHVKTATCIRDNFRMD